MTMTDRVDAITLLTEEYRMVRPPAPKSVKIELTGRCNFACSFCAHAQKHRVVGDMDQVLYRRLAAEMRMAGVEELGMFYLGESFLLDWLPAAIRYAKVECGYPYVYLTTNGSMATPGRVSACMADGLDSLKFSLNYADEEQFKEITNVKGTLFHMMLYNIREAHLLREELGSQCTLSASYIAYDGEQGEAMKPIIEQVRPWVDEIYALPLYNQADLVAEELKDKDWTPVAGNRGRLEALRDSLPCWSIFTEGHVSFDGKLSACCFDHDGRFDMGDLTETPFMEAWHSDKFVTLREAHLEGDVTNSACEKCVAYN